MLFRSSEGNAVWGVVALTIGFHLIAGFDEEEFFEAFGGSDIDMREPGPFRLLLSILSATN